MKTGIMSMQRFAVTVQNIETTILGGANPYLNTLGPCSEMAVLESRCTYATCRNWLCRGQDSGDTGHSSG